jgi:glycosyltransferase involved in cell wall biosynthesis
MRESAEIRILHLIDSPEIAGGQRYLLDLIRRSDLSCKHMVILSYDGPFTKLLREHRFKYDLISMESKFSFKSILKIRQYIHDEKINIVNTHGYRCNFYGRLACLFTGVPNVATVHVSLYDYVDTPPFVRRIYILIERMTSFMTSKYICISAAMRDDMLKMGIRGQKIAIIHNGVDLAVFSPRDPDKRLSADLGIGGHHPIIGTVGRMVTEKGQLHLIEALSYLRDRWPMLRCLFIGTGPLLDPLKKRAEALGLAETCIFQGVRMDIADIYPLMDLFVLPSLREPFGLVLLEAMASGVPVISTASGGPLDFIQSGINGILVLPSDPIELAAQIDFLLSDPEIAVAIAKQGYETVQKGFDIKETTRQVCDLYHSSVSPVR